MICTETGYNTTVTCECRPCEKCDGDGEIADSYTDGETGRGPNCRTVYSYKTCPECKGTGQYKHDCSVRGHDAELDECTCEIDSICSPCQIALALRHTKYREILAGPEPPIEWDGMDVTRALPPADLTPPQWAEFRLFLVALTPNDVRMAANMARAESITRRAA